MARLYEAFDATSVEPNKPFELLPPGRYVVQIVNSEMRPTKDGMGQLLWLELDVLEGACAGRKLFDRLNLVNANPTTVEIAQRPCRRSAMVGKMQVDDQSSFTVPLIADMRAAAEEQLRRPERLRYLPLEQAPVAAGRGSAGASRSRSSPRSAGERASGGQADHRAMAAQRLSQGAANMQDDAAELPPTRDECRALLATLTGEVAAIKTRIAAADLERQRRRGRVDPQQFQAWRAALSDRQRQIERLTRHMSALPSPRDVLKDRLLEVLRADYDEIAWQTAIEKARRMMTGEGLA